MEASLPLALLGLTALLLLGAARVVWQQMQTIQKRKFAGKYLETYRNVLSSQDEGNFDQEKYEWLAMQANRMQDQLGDDGLLTISGSGLQPYPIRNYQLVINLLPKIRQATAPHEHLHILDDGLLRHYGELKHSVSTGWYSRVFNPLAWLAEGARLIITLPLQLAYMAGLMGRNSYARVAGSWLTGLLAFILSLVASIITIVLGWDEALQTAQQWLGR